MRHTRAGTITACPLKNIPKRAKCPSPHPPGEMARGGGGGTGAGAGAVNGYGTGTGNGKGDWDGHGPLPRRMLTPSVDDPARGGGTPYQNGHCVWTFGWPLRPPRRTLGGRAGFGSGSAWDSKAATWEGGGPASSGSELGTPVADDVDACAAERAGPVGGPGARSHLVPWVERTRRVRAKIPTDSIESRDMHRGPLVGRWC